MKKIFDLLFGPTTIFAIFTVASIMALITGIELKVLNIPEKYADGIWFSNITLTFIVYFVSKALKKTDED